MNENKHVCHAATVGGDCQQIRRSSQVPTTAWAEKSEQCLSLSKNDENACFFTWSPCVAKIVNQTKFINTNNACSESQDGRG